MNPNVQPTRVQNRPAEMSRRSSEKINEHDPPVVNPNIHHKEALSLRLALGSILAPVRRFTIFYFQHGWLFYNFFEKKRPFTPASRSSSGTASPAHPSSFAVSGSPQPPPPPNSTPNTASDSGRSDSYLHPRGIYHLHTPSRLGRSVSWCIAYHSQILMCSAVSRTQTILNCHQGRLHHLRHRHPLRRLAVAVVRRLRLLKNIHLP